MDDAYRYFSDQSCAYCEHLFVPNPIRILAFTNLYQGSRTTLPRSSHSTAIRFQHSEYNVIGVVGSTTYYCDHSKGATYRMYSLRCSLRADPLQQFINTSPCGPRTVFRLQDFRHELVIKARVVGSRDTVEQFMITSNPVLSRMFDAFLNLHDGCPLLESIVLRYKTSALICFNRTGLSST